MYLPSATAVSLQQPDLATSPDRVRTAARELESQFARMMIKSMRETSGGNAMFGGDTTYRDMYDQKLADQLTKGRGLGLAPVIERQLNRTLNPEATTGTGAPLPLPGRSARAGMPLGASPVAAAMAMPAGGMAMPARNPMLMHKGLMQELPMATPALHLARTDSGTSMDVTAPVAAPFLPEPAAARPVKLDASSPEAFVKSIWPAAQETAKELGVSARALVAQAALETGWGRKLVGGADSHNLFGIKATGGWDGNKVSSGTHEFYGGKRVDIRDDFRAYDSVRQSFDDYADLMRSKRYAGALAAGDDPARFASALQKAGYATDPSYAAKITSIANGPTLRRALDALPADGLPAGRMVAMGGTPGTRGGS